LSMKKSRKGKKFISAMLGALLAMNLFVTNISAEESAQSAGINISAKSAVLMEAKTGKILFEKDSRKALPPASITKIMTLLLIYEAVEAGQISWEDEVCVSAHAASMGGSQVYLEEGETQTAADMTKCIAIASANDAAVAMAEYIAGSEEAFVERMNSRAKELGMEEACFVNACGLDTEGHIMSAHDIALMSSELITEFPNILELTSTWQDSIIHRTRRGESEFGLTNTNKLIRWYNGATGLKTGSTGDAGYCLSGTAKKNGMQLVAVVMGAESSNARFSETMQLLDYGGANFELISGIKAGEPIAEAGVYKGEAESVRLVAAEDIEFVVEKGAAGKLEFENVISEMMNAPVEKGASAGEVIAKADGKEVGRVRLVTESAVPRMTFAKMFLKLLREWA